MAAIVAKRWMRDPILATITPNLFFNFYDQTSHQAGHIPGKMSLISAANISTSFASLASGENVIEAHVGHITILSSSIFINKGIFFKFSPSCCFFCIGIYLRCNQKKWRKNIKKKIKWIFTLLEMGQTRRKLLINLSLAQMLRISGHRLTKRREADDSIVIFDIEAADYF